MTRCISVTALTRRTFHTAALFVWDNFQATELKHGELFAVSLLGALYKLAFAFVRSLLDALNFWFLKLYFGHRSCFHFFLNQTRLVGISECSSSGGKGSLFRLCVACNGCLSGFGLPIFEPCDLLLEKPDVLLESLELIHFLLDSPVIWPLTQLNHIFVILAQATEHFFDVIGMRTCNKRKSEGV